MTPAPRAAGELAPVRDEAPGTAGFRDDVLRGLASPRPGLPCKYLYDERGAELFDAICRLDAYYLTRVERTILDSHLPEMAEAIGPRARIVEFGSGSAVKAELLLAHLDDPVAYLPVDLAREQLAAVAATLARRFPAVEILPVCADYTRSFELPATRRSPRRTVVFFPGSTIGNFEPHDAVRFLARAAGLCGPGGALLVGVDRVKDPQILERAYNDPEGVTAEFNLNLLERLRRELDAGVEPGGFEHRAVYDRGARRIEMRLVSRRHQEVRVPGPDGQAVFAFAPGDEIVTEHSYKYDVPGFTGLAAAAGLRTCRVWSDPDGWFSVYLLAWGQDQGGQRHARR